ncbi:hypothetical protein T265_07431 [Opisthorchis viverrini]|uniref:Uncharacterized protein n=1 Tax=Opisthorchis viverrini TaxID=6198 RepID=A0A074ZH68_OPIVI|nr:hypothetical protein T265_07431 [Opisthorchis viverrini]KER25037.1 hypothetical protein T265_07431 [Opisthorchis viverrini]
MVRKYSSSDDTRLLGKSIPILDSCSMEWHSSGGSPHSAYSKSWPSAGRWVVNLESPSTSGVSDCISLLKRHRAAGPDDLPSADFKDVVGLSASACLAYLGLSGRFVIKEGDIMKRAVGAEVTRRLQVDFETRRTVQQLLDQ